MSTPQNPLDRYRSHSIHYILTAGATTEALRNFSVVEPEGRNNFLNMLEGKKLGEEISPGAFLIVDSRKTAEFNITNVTLETTPIDRESKTSSLLYSGTVSINIHDPSGVGFYNYLFYLASEKLKMQIGSFKFNLNIIFVGHTDTGNSEIIQTSGISLQQAGTLSLSSYGASGANYELVFVATAGGISDKCSEVVKMPSTVSFMVKDSLLGNAIQNLENQLNLISKNHYDSVNYQKIESNSDTVEQTKKKGKLVQYMITIPEDWFYYTIPTQAAGQPERQFGAVAPEHGTAWKNKIPSAQFTSVQNSTISDTILGLLRLCPEIVRKFDNSASKDGNGKILKILTSITSDDDMELIHFDAIEYGIPNKNRNTDKVTDNKTSQSKENHMEFDYVFSGKNIDILDFQFTIANLFTSQNAPLVSTVAKDEHLESGQSTKKTGKTPINPVENLVGFGENTPIYPSSQSSIEKDNAADYTTRTDIKHNQTLVNSQIFHKNLSNLMMSTQEVQMKIRGNPTLFSDCIASSSPKHIKLSSSISEYANSLTAEKIEASTKWEYDIASKSKPKGSNSVIAAHQEHRKWITEMESKSSDNMMLNSRFLKVNIYGPKDYPFSSELSDTFRTKLFYDGYYLVHNIKHIFNGSDFTQEIGVVMVDAYGSYPTSNPSTKQAPN